MSRRFDTMSLHPQPLIIQPEVFASLPERFRVKRRSAWSDTNLLGASIDSFFEGPCFDDDGYLYITDIPFGRIFRISPEKEWELVAEYDGWPCGVKIRADGKLVITDNRLGLVLLDPATGSVSTLVETFRTEGLKGINDLTFASNGDIYFTDQGQTGLQDPSGRVFRLTASGTLELLLANIPSPNGLVFNLSETQLYVAVTRANAVWRLPLTADGGVTKVGTWLQLSGGLAGPDGLALDVEGGLIVAHPGIGVWRFDHLGRPTHCIDGSAGRFTTNIAFGGRANSSIYITDSERGEILRAELPVAGRSTRPT
jgi:gluconolactonase